MNKRVTQSAAEAATQPGPAPVTPATIDALQAAVSVLHAQGARQARSVRLDFIEALARRAANHEGEVRRVLEGRLARTLAGCAQPQAGAGVRPLEAHAARSQTPVQGGRLAELLHHVARQGPAGVAGDSLPTTPARGNGPTDLKALSQFRGTWSALSVDRQLSRSLTKVPENAGPLNSHHLAWRTLTAMRDISPAYLGRFTSYVDALFWLEQQAAGGTPAQAAALGPGADSARSRKPRSRRPG